MRLRMLPLPLLPLVLAGCGSLDVFTPCRSGYRPPDLADLGRELSAARTRWQTAGIQAYRFDFAQYAAPSSLPLVRITVRGGRVESVETLREPPPGDPTTTAGRTVEDLYAEEAGALDTSARGECRELDFDFDPGDGHPLSKSSGTALKNIADGFGSWTVSNFTRL